MKSPGTGRRWPLAQARRDQPGPLCPLGNRGVLFLDELPEFGNRMLEMLRQPLDPTGRAVSISRSAGSLTYPANFTLIASMNPCPCGPCGSDPEKECTCSMSMIKSYYPEGTGKKNIRPVAGAPCGLIRFARRSTPGPPVPFGYLKN